MYRWLRWPALLCFAALVGVSPAFAADETTHPSGELVLNLQAPAAPPAPSGVSNPTELQLPPMRLASVSTYTGFDTTLLATQSQPLLQVGDPGANRVMSRPVQWAIYGAAIGLVVGLIDEDPVEKALIGGVVGFGLGYVIRN